MTATAVFTIRQDDQSHHAILYPIGEPGFVAALAISALDFAWPLPRFEAADWMAALLAAAKPKRLCGAIAENATIEPCRDWRDGPPPNYRYELTCSLGRLHIRAFRRDMKAAGLRFEPIYSGDLKGFGVFVGIPKPLSLGERYLAVFQAPETGLFTLTFQGTPDEAQELADRIRSLIDNRFLKDGEVIRVSGAVHAMTVENIHLAIDQILAQSQRSSGEQA